MQKRGSRPQMRKALLEYESIVPEDGSWAPVPAGIRNNRTWLWLERSRQVELMEWGGGGNRGGASRYRRTAPGTAFSLEE